MSDDTNATPLSLPWKRFAGAVAWPTVLLWLVCLVGVASSTTLVVTESIPLWAGASLDTAWAYVAFTPMHEAAHGNVRGRHARWRWLELLVGHSAGLLLLAPFPAFRALHLRHHSHTNDPERDPDMWVAGHDAPSIAVRCLTILPHYYGRFLFGRAGSDRSTRSLRIATLSVFALIAVVLAVAVWQGSLGLVLALWVGPAIAASGILAFAFDWLPHHPHVGRSRHQDTRLVGGTWLTVPMLGQNYHLVHHLYPRVPFYSYGRCLRSRDARTR